MRAWFLEGIMIANYCQLLEFMSDKFQIHSPFEPAGDQPEAIKGLLKGLDDGLAHQTLLGVTGSGKTFTMEGTRKQPGLCDRVIKMMLSGGMRGVCMLCV